ncbi:MAG: hypothetical protein RRY47_03105 [Oscillospiraceae bacterium]
MKNNKIALVAALALGATILGGCAKKPAVESPTPPPPSAPVTEPSAPAVSQKPETDATAKEFTLNLEGKEEKVSMDIAQLDFSAAGGPKLSIYVDNSRYSLASLEGLYTIVPSNSGENSTYAQITFNPGKTADEMANTMLTTTGAEYSLNDLGKQDINGLSARSVEGSMTSGNTMRAFYIDTDGGCIAIDIRAAAEAGEGHGARLVLSAQSIAAAK